MEDLEILKKRLLYQSQHRGIKEMDMILGEFAQKRLRSMTFEELRNFEALLATPDQILYGWIVKKGPIPKGVSRSLILKIQQFCDR